MGKAFKTLQIFILFQPSSRISLCCLYGFPGSNPSNQNFTAMGHGLVRKHFQKLSSYFFPHCLWLGYYCLHKNSETEFPDFTWGKYSCLFSNMLVKRTIIQDALIPCLHPTNPMWPHSVSLYWSSYILCRIWRRDGSKLKMFLKVQISSESTNKGKYFCLAHTLYLGRHS